MVAPIASHLCHLVLLCDCAEEPEQFSHLEEAAQAVAKATENMAAVASRYLQGGIYWGTLCNTVGATDCKSPFTTHNLI